MALSEFKFGSLSLCNCNFTGFFKHFEYLGKVFSFLRRPESLTKYVTGDFNTPFELKELEQFYEEHKTELGKAKRLTLNQIEKVRASFGIEK